MVFANALFFYRFLWLEETDGKPAAKKRYTLLSATLDNGVYYA
jgi:hypothetical protein